MPDRFYLSLWLKDHQEAEMLDRFRVLLQTFPYSEVKPLPQSVRVYPLTFSEHPLLEEDFREGAQIDHLLKLAGEFLHADCAYEVAANWDLWAFQKNGGPAGWKKIPHAVTLLCFGPEFEEGRDERGDLQVDFGLDTPFRADQLVPDSQVRAITKDYRDKLQDNIHKLLEFAHTAESRLPMQKRLLWTESGENFAEIVRQSFR